jgi:Wiskott-Aldrich syndrome protein
MDPEERKKMEEAKKPAQTGDVKAKMALLAGGGDNSGAGTSNAPNTVIMVNKNAPPPPPPPPPPKGMVSDNTYLCTIAPSAASRRS